MKAVVPSLVEGINDENTDVKSSCEIALVSVLDLYNGEEIAQVIYGSIFLMY